MMMMTLTKSGKFAGDWKPFLFFLRHPSDNVERGKAEQVRCSEHLIGGGVEYGCHDGEEDGDGGDDNGYDGQDDDHDLMVKRWGS